MKKFRFFCICMCVILLLGVLPAAASETTDHTETPSTEMPTVPAPTSPYLDDIDNSSVASGCHSLEAQMPVWGKDQLLPTAGAAMLYELNSDTMVYSWNADTQVHPASLVKIMTCLLALENCELSETVTVTTTAIATLPKDTTLYLKIGAKTTMEEMLYCLMVGGWNDAAAVIAEHVAGSQNAFVAMMNARAKEIGCTGTVFKNATGFHHNEQLSTTRDLVKILREALNNEHFMTFFSETIHRLPETVPVEKTRYMETTNYMMTQTITQEYYDLRVTGGRTGVTEDRERCLIVTAESKGMHYIAIVMCAKATYDDEGNIVRFGSYEEVKEMLNKVFSGHQITQVLASDQILNQYPVTNGENSVVVGPSETVYTVLPDTATTSDLSYRFQETQSALSAPVKAGEFITNVQVWYGNVCVGQSPVITRNGSDVAQLHDQSVMIEENTENFKIALRVIGILAAIAALIGGTYYIVISIRKASVAAQYKRRRKYRRRTK